PTVNTNPQPQTICANSSTSFTASFTGGSPTPTLKWQESTDGGIIYFDLMDVGPYSGTTTNTLNITNALYGMNGNRYRLKATNSCGDVFTTGALLTVNAEPPTIVMEPENVSTCVG